MPLEILTPEEMAQADRLTIEAGTPGFELIRRAARAVANEALRRWPELRAADVLCGPGNNGGDGYLVTCLLAEAGWQVTIHAEGEPRPGSDAARARAEVKASAFPLDRFEPRPGALVVDALYGAGLSRPLAGAAAQAARRCAEAKAPVLAVDLPSGLDGRTGWPIGDVCFKATATVTFARPKPAHLLLPGRTFCGQCVVADIGIPENLIARVGSQTIENVQQAWMEFLRPPPLDAHKYSRGHAVVFTGGPTSSGAARLASRAAARAGAGAVTLLAPPAALAVNAARLDAIMLARIEGAEEAERFIGERKAASAVIGPGYGGGPRLHEMVERLLAAMAGDALPGGLVLDADALTVFKDRPEALGRGIAAVGGRVVLTPHEGEFMRLFPDLPAEGKSKLERAREAARRMGGVVLLKGPDTVVAAPDGRAAISGNGTPWLATAGSGDVLAGIIGGLLAQKIPPFEAACAGAWIHAEAGTAFGPGLTADDLPEQIPAVLRTLYASTKS